MILATSREMTLATAGTAKFNHHAAQHYACCEKDPTDPPECALEAIEPSGIVETAPAIEAGCFSGVVTIARSASDRSPKHKPSRWRLCERPPNLFRGPRDSAPQGPRNNHSPR